ncbi:sigma 54-interacting transcriptional regulator [Metaclostridioides mangenotii]|uniref:sigma 54-interacting transcriptional regulator n=1 Tax=Metaclostridioides mangenotii TaxID=1540 RepID=UPI000AA479DB|nr:sigma 54-interacting transcriptional regulator [Clostridioides mangenotii]
MRLVDMGADVIVVIGGGDHFTFEKIGVPIINLNLKTEDILNALHKSKKYSKTVVLIIDNNKINSDYRMLKELLNIDIEEEFFDLESEVENSLLKYLDRINEVVIVGERKVCDLAEKYGIDNEAIEVGEKSIREVINYSKNILKAADGEVNNKVLTGIFEKIDAGIIFVDSKGKVLVCNGYARKILNVNEKGILNRFILNVCPQMNWIVERSIQDEYDKLVVRKINDVSVCTRTDLIKVGRDTFGILGVILDMTKLQRVENKIAKNALDQGKEGLNSRYTFQDFKYKDRVTKEFIEEAKIVGQTDYTLLLNGESGSGKEIIAHSIHDISKRGLNNFVPINCSAISESLLESELFGYEEGAFTGARKGGKRGIFELANKGTLFLDEINTLPLSIQTKLLRVIEERQIMRIGSDHLIPLDIRIIAATNEPLIDKIEQGLFRADLFYRLSSLELNIPPLRERKRDILHLFRNFVYETMLENSMDKLNGVNGINLTDNEIKILNDYNWPGNVRELKNVARKYVITGKIKLGKYKSSSLYVVKNENVDNEVTEYNVGDINSLNIDIKEIQKSVEVKIIDMMIEQGLSKNEIAKILGISRTSLWKKYNQNV